MKSLAMVVLLASCQPRTELILGVATDLHATDQLSNVNLTVTLTDTGVPIIVEDWPITGPGNMPFNLPGSFGIFPEGDDKTINITLTGTGGSVTVTREAVVSLVDDQTLFYRMGLTSECMVTLNCAQGQSCVEGHCQNTQLDAGQFPTFDNNLVTSLTCKTATTPNYIATLDGTAMQLSPDAPPCLDALCSEGTCLAPPCEFKCGDGSCIMASQVCNGTSDCSDSSDENPSVCLDQGSCCEATNGCPGETGDTCGNGCCCCPGGEACSANHADGCTASP